MSARLSPQQKALRSISEREWQTTVEQIATAYGWRWFHAPDNKPVKKRDGSTYVQNVKAGFPDLVLLRGPELMFVELKSEVGRLSDAQREWIAAFEAAGHPVWVWRPSDLELVKRLLRVGCPFSPLLARPSSLEAP